MPKTQAPPPQTPNRSVERLFTIPVSSLDHIDHAVTDEECAARGQTNRGEFRAICGTSFLPSAMEDAPGRSCPRCRALLQEAHRPVQRATCGAARKASKRGLVSRLRTRHAKCRQSASSMTRDA